MNEKIMMTKRFKLVNMGEAQISTLEKPIIGTDSLASCVGILLYSEEDKKAVVAHASSDVMPVLDEIFTLLIKNKLYRKPLKYKIIWGTDLDPAKFYELEEIFRRHFLDYTEFDDELFSGGVRIDMETMSREFAFDSSKGCFVTDKVLFGSDYYVVNNEVIIDNKKIK